MESEKRQFVRKRTDHLLYAELGPDNGSILLNLSPDGCSFQSIAPVRDKQVRFTVSIGDGRKLEGDGLMVWSDGIKKTGGLRFLNPSPELREQVQQWLHQALVTTDGQLDPAAVESEAKRRRKQLREEAKASAELKRLRPKEDRTASAAESEVSQILHTSDPAAPPLPPGWADDALHLVERKPVGTWRGLGTMALLAMIFMAMVTYRRELGHGIMSMGSSLAGDQQKGASPPVSTPGPTESTLPQTVTGAPLVVLPDTAATTQGAQILPASSEQVAQPSEEQPVLPKPHAVKSADAPPDLASLWSSVESGDTHAEVTLASRYLRGEGVPRSCAQARVLLEAAVKRGSAEAKQRLDEWGQAGCP